jgi:hypothetical protein
LLSAYAVHQAGHQPIIYSRKVKSVIPGSQHLQAAIPGVTSQYPEEACLFVRIGTAEQYAQKVYGDPDRRTGWEAYHGVFPSWRVQTMYDSLWEQFKDVIVDAEINQETLKGLSDTYPLVIATIPAGVLCCQDAGVHPRVSTAHSGKPVPGHSFESVPYWIKPMPTPEVDDHREVVVFNGLPQDWWYRWSILGGKCSIESSHFIEGDDVVGGVKAIGNNCDCWPNIVRAGRWAQWRHGVLLHHAYQEVEALMKVARL